MNKKKKILAAIIAATMITSSMSGLCFTASAATTIIVNENFGDSAAESPDAVEGITWGDLTVAEAGTYLGKTDGTTINTGAISLSANADKNLMEFAEGMTGVEKDFSMSFSAASYGYGQADHNWYLIYKDTAGTEMFRIKFTVGNWASTGTLIAGDQSVAINGVATKSSFSTTQVDVSFSVNGGGVVTVDGKSLAFASGSSIGSIGIAADGAGDQGRPIYMDDIQVSLVDKYATSINIASTEAGESVEGAVLTIGNDTYTVGAEGTVSTYLLPGEYQYEVKLAKHDATTGTFTVVEGENTVNVQLEYVGDPVPTTIEIAGGEEYIYLPTSGTATSKAFAATVYDNAGLVMDNAVVEWSLPGQPDTISIADGVVTLTPDYSLTDDNGVDVIVRATVNYTDKDGAAKSVSQDTSIHIHNTARATSWTIAGPAVAKDGAPTTYSVTDVKDQYGNAFEENCSFVLTSSDPKAVINGMTITPNVGTSRTEEITLTVELADTTTEFDVAEGVTAAALIKAAYNEDGTLASVDVEEVNVSGGKVTMDGAPASNEKYMLWDSLEGLKPVGTMSVKTEASGTAMDRTVTVYGYDFYEPGTGTASCGEPRMEVVNEVNSIVWPKSSGSTASTTITLPVPVKLEAGTAKMITFDNIATNKTVGSQERSLHFLNSEGAAVISVDFAGASVVKDYSKNSDGNFVGTEIGKLNELNVSSSAIFVLKTNADGITSAVLSYNNSTLEEYVVSETPVTDIAAIKLTGGQGAPDDRLLTLTNIVISDSDVAEVEIVGDSAIAKISGMTASKKFKGSIFSQVEGETFTWSVADPNGDPIEGVTIDQDGVLSVTDVVAADTTAVISYTSSLSSESSPKLATHEVTIKDFAAVTSFDVDGPVAVNAGESVTYSVKNIVDEYGDEVNMPVSYAITAGNDVATVDAATGVVTTTGVLGKFTVSVTVGNPDKTMTKTIEAEVAKYNAVGEGTGSVEVDVTELANYAADTKYLVTTATADGVLVNQTEVAHTNGKVTVDMTGATKYEVSPIYSYNNVGNIAAGKVIPLGDGLYDFTFKKANGTRADIYVNGAMVGNNVDQSGKGRSTNGSEYTVKDVVVQGGSATVVMKDNTSDMTSIVAKKAPSILPRKTHVYVLGDSLVANYQGTFADADGDGIPTAGDAQTGWGQVIDQFISDDLNVTNLGESGNYAVGLQGAPFSGVLANAKPGDYLIMECGYNDANYSSESAMATALEEIAADCKKAGITLILSTPNFGTARGDTNKADVKFGPKILEVAREQGVLGVNLSGMGHAEFTASGKTADYWTQNFNVYYDGVVQDNLHLSYHGAMKNACYVMQAIYNAQQDTTNPELAASLANLKVDTTARTLIDSEGQTMTLQVKAAE